MKLIGIYPTKVDARRTAKMFKKRFPHIKVIVRKGPKGEGWGYGGWRVWGSKG